MVSTAPAFKSNAASFTHVQATNSSGQHIDLLYEVLHLHFRYYPNNLSQVLKSFKRLNPHCFLYIIHASSQPDLSKPPTIAMQTTNSYKSLFSPASLNSLEDLLACLRHRLTTNQRS